MQTLQHTETGDWYLLSNCVLAPELHHLKCAFNLLLPFYLLTISKGFCIKMGKIHQESNPVGVRMRWNDFLYFQINIDIDGSGVHSKYLYNIPGEVNDGK